MKLCGALLPFLLFIISCSNAYECSGTTHSTPVMLDEPTLGSVKISNCNFVKGLTIDGRNRNSSTPLSIRISATTIHVAFVLEKIDELGDVALVNVNATATPWSLSNVASTARSKFLFERSAFGKTSFQGSTFSRGSLVQFKDSSIEWNSATSAPTYAFSLSSMSFIESSTLTLSSSTVSGGVSLLGTQFVDNASFTIMDGTNITNRAPTALYFECSVSAKVPFHNSSSLMIHNSYIALLGPLTATPRIREAGGVHDRIIWAFCGRSAADYYKPPPIGFGTAVSTYYDSVFMENGLFVLSNTSVVAQQAPSHVFGGTLEAFSTEKLQFRPMTTSTTIHFYRSRFAASRVIIESSC